VSVNQTLIVDNSESLMNLVLVRGCWNETSAVKLVTAVLRMFFVQQHAVCKQHFRAVHKAHIDGNHSASAFWWTPFFQPCSGHETARGKCNLLCKMCLLFRRKNASELFITPCCIKFIAVSADYDMLLLLLTMAVMST